MNLICLRHLVLTVFEWWFQRTSEPELSYILVKLFNKCLKESFSRLLEGFIGVLCINVGKGLQLKATALLFFFL